MGEDKQKILDKLVETLKLTRAGIDIDTMEYYAPKQYVLIKFKSGFSRAVNVACDSGIAMIRDVLKVL